MRLYISEKQKLGITNAGNKFSKFYISNDIPEKRNLFYLSHIRHEQIMCAIIMSTPITETGNDVVRRIAISTSPLLSSEYKNKRRGCLLLFTILVSRSYPEAPVQAASPKQLTLRERKSKTSAMGSPMTTGVSTKLFIRRYCCLQELPNGFTNAPCSGMLRNRKKLEKTVRLPEALMLHFREKFHGRSRSTSFGNFATRTLSPKVCAWILRFTIKTMAIPMFTFYCRPVA